MRMRSKRSASLIIAGLILGLAACDRLPDRTRDERIGKRHELPVDRDSEALTNERGPGRTD